MTCGFTDKFHQTLRKRTQMPFTLSNKITSLKSNGHAINCIYFKPAIWCLICIYCIHVSYIIHMHVCTLKPSPQSITPVSLYPLVIQLSCPSFYPQATTNLLSIIRDCLASPKTLYKWNSMMHILFFLSAKLFSDVCMLLHLWMVHFFVLLSSIWLNGLNIIYLLSFLLSKYSASTLTCNGLLKYYFCIREQERLLTILMCEMGYS